MPYQREQDALVASIRGGTPINNGRYAAQSTLMAIMGRMATYTGQRVTWEQAWDSTERLTVERYAFGPVEVPPVALPGITPLRSILTQPNEGRRHECPLQLWPSPKKADDHQ